jgi:UTP-glucose-1-phosphate uridylyltransferase
MKNKITKNKLITSFNGLGIRLLPANKEMPIQLLPTYDISINSQVAKEVMVIVFAGIISLTK